ncbi:MAG: hypothetical protein K940chlam8_01014 [Chlamydiae bacterium]|nr:hypothetical protein [Chlamydiota bacterium]
MVKLKNRRFFTLIEFVAIFVLMTTTLVVLVFPGRKVTNKKRFDRSVNALVNRMQIAKHMAFHYDTQVNLLIEQDEKGFFCSLIFDEMPKSMLFELFKSVYLEGVKDIFVNNQRIENFSFEYVSKLGIQNPTPLKIQSSFDHNCSFDIY